ncbi:MAG: flippase-like domain-containing protein, partial [Sandaracinaceae bacterium]|nr:flippase-like domain-containing protein [Sandaracinaceae bacterium]
MGALSERLHELDARWLLVAVLLHGVAVLAGVLRWRSLLGAAGVELPLGWLARSFLVGRFVGAFTPSTAGLDGWRIWDAGTASGAMGKARRPSWSKLVGLIGMALVCAALVPFGGARCSARAPSPSAPPPRGRRGGRARRHPPAGAPRAPRRAAPSRALGPRGQGHRGPRLH